MSVQVPRIIVSIMANQPDQALARAGRIAASGADICEWRLDQLADPMQAPALLPALVEVSGGMPLLATVRSKSEGGDGQLAPAELQRLCKQLCSTGLIDFWDVEYRQPGADVLRDIARQQRVQVIASQHDFAGTPPLAELLANYAAMQDFGADIAKLAVTANTPLEVAHLLSACAAAADRGPVIAISMGELGRVSRLAGHLFGSVATFAALDGESSAPGQLDITTLQNALGALP